MTTQSMAVASVDAPRRRDEVLPEHEARWPDTGAVRALIEERYDGFAGTAHEIGLSLVTVREGCYPGWRIQQIAEAMGLGHSPAETPAETGAGAICQRCGRPFTFWRLYKGRPSQTRLCHDCYAASRKGEHAEPEPEPEPVYVAGPNFTIADGRDDSDDSDLTFGDLPGSQVVFGMLDLLPTHGRWTPLRRHKWLSAFTAALDLLIEEEVGAQ